MRGSRLGFWVAWWSQGACDPGDRQRALHHKFHFPVPIRHFSKGHKERGGCGTALSTILNMIFIKLHHDRDIVSCCQLAEIWFTRLGHLKKQKCCTTVLYLEIIIPVIYINRLCFPGIESKSTRCIRFTSGSGELSAKDVISRFRYSEVNGATKMDIHGEIMRGDELGLSIENQGSPIKSEAEIYHSLSRHCRTGFTFSGRLNSKSVRHKPRAKEKQKFARRQKV